MLLGACGSEKGRYWLGLLLRHLWRALLLAVIIGRVTALMLHLNGHPSSSSQLRLVVFVQVCIQILDLLDGLLRALDADPLEGGLLTFCAALLNQAQ